MMNILLMIFVLQADLEGHGYMKQFEIRTNKCEDLPQKQKLKASMVAMIAL